MTDDTNAGGEWITGVIGEPFQVDADGKPIPNANPEPSDAPDLDPEAMRKLWETAGSGSDPNEIGGNNDKVQADIWDKMDRGEFGAGSEGLPADVETIVD